MAGKEASRAILEYWTGLGEKAWFARNDEVDREIADKFGEIHSAAAAGRLDDWKAEPDSCLALVILLDQFSRNMFRGDARAFAQDAHALEIARAALASGHDRQVEPRLRFFLCLPFEHSESIVDQNHCVALTHGMLGPGEALKYAIIHRDVIARFGRFPHRNAALGRHTTPAEQAFLDGGGFSA